MSDIESLLIRASAGSGKTWQLANRFLALVVLGVKPERIIALTFTRKAAGEFADRILTMLAEGASDEVGAEKLAEQIRETIVGGDSISALVDGDVEMPTMSVGFFRVRLEEMTQVLDRLALSTLDSFFVKIVKQFTFELGLAGFELLEGSELEKAKMEVLGEMFSARAISEGAYEKFLDAFKLATMGNEETRLSETLKEFVKSYHFQWLKSPEAGKWGNEERVWEGGMPWGGCADRGKVAARGVELLEEMELHGTLRKSMVKAVEWLGERVKGSPTTDMPPHVGSALEAIEDIRGGKWVRLYSRKEYEFEGEILELLDALLSAFVRDELEVRFERTRGVFEVIDTYERLYEKSVRGKGRLGFADLGLLLAGNESMSLWDSVARDMVDFRFDGRYDHWMLDEFQDTSRTQWKVIEGLLDEVMQDAEGGRSLFVVGDKKQGIYGWRGGEPELFGELAERYGDRLKDWPMDRSFRSTPEVLSLVNQVCDPESGGMKSIFPSEALERWDFQRHDSAVGGRGHAWVCQMEKDDELSAAEVNHAWIGGLVERLDPVKRKLSCAVLVRKNKEAREIGEYLREHYPEIPVAMDSEVKVAEDHPTTVAVMDAFRFLVYPKDTLAWEHVRMSPLGKVLGTDRGFHAVWYDWTGQVAKRGVGAVLQSWVEGLDSMGLIGEYARGRLGEMERAAVVFGERGGGLADWLEFLGAWSQKEVTRDGVVQIMTVYKAKGLGFDAVILPDFGGDQFDAFSNVNVLEAKGERGEVKHHLLAPKKEVAQADSVLREQVQRWSVDQCYEAFCVLYVALSRAKSGVYVLLSPPSKSGGGVRKLNADWIRASVGDISSRSEELGGVKGEILLEEGDWEWLPDVEAEALPEVDERSVKLAELSARGSGRLASDHGQMKYGMLLLDRRGLDIGNEVHGCFERIEWYDDSTVLKGSDRVVEMVRAVFDDEGVRELFTQKEGVEVYREQSVEFMLDGAWVSGVIDRLHVRRVGGAVEEVVVIDFKTDSVESGEAFLEKYSEQVSLYKKAVAGIFGIPEALVRGVLISTHLKCQIVCYTT